MTQQSNIGNLADLKEGEILLPEYLLRRDDGIFVKLSHFPVGGGFAQFIDRLFATGSRFLNLDYQLLLDLLYDYDAILDAHGIESKIRLAEDIVPFSSKRKSLYKAVKIDSASERAEYFFEPVTMEVVTEEHVYGEPDDDGIAPILDTTRKVEMLPAKLDRDEFIADMWLKGVRFGVQVEMLVDVVARGEMGRMTVALQQDATAGCDAEVEEACSELHRDNSPKILLNGKADLRQFQNRFPQIEKDAKLLKKRMRVLGKPGFKVNGQIIEPDIPKDLDLLPLAGVGTRIEVQDGNEYILSNRDGFLSIDMHTNSISVTEKIENKGGISIKTTGDLSLSGNEFIEHGEVQEGRSVEGKNMTFRSAVYGNIVSQGGFILLESNLSNASAKSLGGDVTTNGRAFNSTIEAWEGVVTMKYAESCLIFGEAVAIERAVNCEIVASKIEIEQAEGCGIAGKSVQIKVSDSCRGKQTVISMLLPDLSALDAQVAQVNTAIENCQKIIAAKDQGIALIVADVEVAKYLALAKSIREGTVKLTDAHKDNWQKMTSKFAKVDNALAKLAAEKQEQLNRIAAFEKENAHLLDMRGKSGTGVHCEIKKVSGDTMVRGLQANHGVSEFQKSKVSEIKIKLREQGSMSDRIFSGARGNLDWNYAVPDVVKPT